MSFKQIHKKVEHAEEAKISTSCLLTLTWNISNSHSHHFHFECVLNSTVFFRYWIHSGKIKICCANQTLFWLDTIYNIIKIQTRFWFNCLRARVNVKRWQALILRMGMSETVFLLVNTYFYLILVYSIIQVDEIIFYFFLFCCSKLVV